ncbi:MAG: phospholipase D family protein [Humibacillus sp.]|nr:phospholipase D family protein [Humibacillus sp.]MDN5776604.1 phospholipase D family protein [Humibacillus sp.]
MLLPDSRAVLIEALRPPVGHTLDGAIATTFTLDLTAAVIPPLAFSSFGGSAQLTDPVSVLESVRSSADRVDIFCQGGNILIPNRAPDLLAFVEPMVHPVRRPPGHLFHPKVWFVRYVDDEGSEAYRLLVLTRNLTSDHAWDIVVRLDSENIWRRRLPENRDLHDFLASLPDRTVTPMSSPRRRRVEALAHAAQYVGWERPEGVVEVTLHYLNGMRRPDFAGRRHLVVSPFLNDSGLDLVAPPDQDVIVVSRPEAFEQLTSEKLARVEAYVVDTMAGISLDEDDEPTTTRTPPPERTPVSLLTGLHAKMLVVEPHGRAQRARVFIGSANATGAAFGGNVEFMVELEGPRRLLGVDVFMGVDGSLRSLVEEYDPIGDAPEDPNEAERRELENALRVVAEIKHTLTVEPAAASEPAGVYDLVLTTARPYPVGSGWIATIELLTRPGIARQAESDRVVNERFTSVETADISPFLSIRMTSPSGLECGTVVLATLVGAPADRLDLVLARQIDTPEKFLRFLYLILSLGDPYLLAQLSAVAGSGDSSGFRPGGPGILELVLQALAEKPAALDDLSRLVRRLSTTDEGRRLLPEGFDRFWSEAETARRRLARRRS